MVRKHLLDIVTLSGIRKELLLYLDDGPRSLSEVRDRFDVTSPEVSPRIKELIEHRLVRLADRKYHLTPMGKTIVRSFRPFVDTLNVFDQYEDFWDEHDLSSIPDEMLHRIGEIRNYLIIEDDPTDMDRTRAELFNVVSRSRSLVGVSCAFDETLPGLCIAAAKSDIPVAIVVTEKIRGTLEKGYKGQMAEFLRSRNAALYVTEEDLRVSHAVTDDCLFFSLCFNNGKFDVNSNLVSNDPSSIRWGLDLFEYYRSRAVRIN